MRSKSFPQHPTYRRSAQLVAALVTVLSLLTACGRSEDSAKEGGPNAAGKAPGAPPAMPVTVALPLERDVRDTDDLSARLEAVESVDVRARVSGYIDSVHFQAGREVTRGELLFVIDPRPFAAELAKVEADLARLVTRADLAKTELARADKLLAVKALSQQEYEQTAATLRESEASIRAARAQVDATKLNVEFTRVTAPISGRLGRAEVTAGNLVSGGTGAATTLTTIVSMDPIYAYFDGDEQSLPKYRALVAAGQKPTTSAESGVLMGLASESGYPRRGRLDFVDNRVDPKTGTVRVRAVFPNPDRVLAPGLFARVRLVGSNKYRALLITDRAIGTDQ
ncbi:MAG: efflux RND transporter periplasmic adaptor subunit, partial [Burkholderiales bacterium]